MAIAEGAPPLRPISRAGTGSRHPGHYPPSKFLHARHFSHPVQSLKEEESPSILKKELKRAGFFKIFVALLRKSIKIDYLKR